jgi:hypothetical protein
MPVKNDQPIGLITFTTESQLRREKLGLWGAVGLLIVLSIGSGIGFYHFVVMPQLIGDAYIRGRVEGYECGSYKDVKAESIPSQCIGG